MKRKNKKPNGSTQPMTPQKYIREKARGLEIGKCYANKGWKENGMTNIMVTRCHKKGNYTVGAYLVDTFALGVVDTTYCFNISEIELKEYMARFREAGDMEEISYNEAHNLIFGALEWADEGGIAPHKDWALTKYILEEDDDRIPIIEYEMGKDGKHYLAARSKAEFNKYYNTLVDNLGEENVDYSILLENPFMEDEFMDREDEYWNRELIHENYIPFDIPDVPEPELKNGRIKEIFENFHLTEEELEEVFSYPFEELKHDMEAIVKYQMNAENIEYCESGSFHSIMCLGEVGDENSLKLVLDTLRLDENYMDDMYGDYSSDAYCNTIIKLGRDRLDMLMEYIKEPGRSPWSRCEVLKAAAGIAVHWPEKKEEVVEWFREVLNYYCEALPKGVGCDSITAAFAIGAVADFGAIELEPEIKNLFATTFVDETICGDYNEILAELIRFPEDAFQSKRFTALNIFSRYKSIVPPHSY